MASYDIKKDIFSCSQISQNIKESYPDIKFVEHRNYGYTTATGPVSVIHELHTMLTGTKPLFIIPA